jgi:hypothetical protein
VVFDFYYISLCNIVVCSHYLHLVFGRLRDAQNSKEANLPATKDGRCGDALDAYVDDAGGGSKAEDEISQLQTQLRVLQTVGTTCTSKHFICGVAFAVNSL